MIAFAACNNSDKSTSETTVSTDTTAKPAETVPPAEPAYSDAEFATKAAVGGMTEVKAGELAVKMGVSKSVKDFGKMMVTDHTKAGNELKGIAQKNNMQLPANITPEKQQKLDELAAKTGADFDKAFVAMMEEGHSETIALFMAESSKGTNADLKAFADKTLPTLNHHMEMVNAAKEAVNK